MSNIIAYVQPGTPAPREEQRPTVARFLQDRLLQALSYSTYYPRAFLHAPPGWLALLQETIRTTLAGIDERQQAQILPWPLETQRFTREWVESAAFSRIATPDSVGLFVLRPPERRDSAAASPAHWSARLVRYLGRHYQVFQAEPQWFPTLPSRSRRSTTETGYLLPLLDMALTLIARRIPLTWRGAHASPRVHDNTQAFLWDRLLPTVPLGIPLGPEWRWPALQNLPRELWGALRPAPIFTLLYAYTAPTDILTVTGSWRNWAGTSESLLPVYSTRTTRTISTTSPLLHDGRYTRQLRQDQIHDLLLHPTPLWNVDSHQNNQARNAEIFLVLLWRFIHRQFRLAHLLAARPEWGWAELRQGRDRPATCSPLDQEALACLSAADRQRLGWNSWLSSMFRGNLEPQVVLTRLLGLGPQSISAIAGAALFTEALTDALSAAETASTRMARLQSAYVMSPPPFRGVRAPAMLPVPEGATSPRRPASPFTPITNDDDEF